MGSDQRHVLLTAACLVLVLLRGIVCMEHNVLWHVEAPLLYDIIAHVECPAQKGPLGVAVFLHVWVCQEVHTHPLFRGQGVWHIAHGCYPVQTGTAREAQAWAAGGMGEGQEGGMEQGGLGGSSMQHGGRESRAEGEEEAGGVVQSNPSPIALLGASGIYRNNIICM